MRPVRVLVGEPLPILRTSVSDLLGQESGFEVVGVGTLAEVLEVAGAGWPDVALLDVDLPPAGGLDAARQLSEQYATHAIVWGFEPIPEDVLGASRTGALGFLDKDTSVSQLARTLRWVVHGDLAVDPPGAVPLKLVPPSRGRDALPACGEPGEHVAAARTN